MEFSFDHYTFLQSIFAAKNYHVQIRSCSLFQTPTNLKEQGRFDTIFYVAFSESLPQEEAVEDNAEVSAVIWSNPDQVLEQNRGKELWLAPPQVYELSRLKNFPNYDKLKKFCEERSKNGLITWMPYIIPVGDGAVSIYPQVPFEVFLLSSSHHSLQDLFIRGSELNHRHQIKMRV